MDAIAQSKSEKVVGDASVILLLCRKARVKPLTGEIQVLPSKAIDAIWICKMNVVPKTEDTNRQGEGTQPGDNMQRSDPMPELPPGVTPTYRYHHYVNEESYAHQVEMRNF
ncbi:unnamed protein product [Vicia faba]|uniref:Uncharacterized protein n=1 Tax=Vicia faba TaxID=3906 RepID=A0AAV0YVX6_VICFA|nr:unnamed protein product [Vicia faba]